MGGAGGGGGGRGVDVSTVGGWVVRWYGGMAVADATVIFAHLGVVLLRRRLVPARAAAHGANATARAAAQHATSHLGSRSMSRQGWWRCWRYSRRWCRRRPWRGHLPAAPARRVVVVVCAARGVLDGSPLLRCRRRCHHRRRCGLRGDLHRHGGRVRRCVGERRRRVEVEQVLHGGRGLRGAYGLRHARVVVQQQVERRLRVAVGNLQGGGAPRRREAHAQEGVHLEAAGKSVTMTVVVSRTS